jgi:hypothetical protein
VILGYNPAKELIGPHVLARLPEHDAAVISGRGFFPHRIAAPFRGALHQTFAFTVAACLVAAAASWSRGRQIYRPGVAASEMPIDQEAA